MTPTWKINCATVPAGRVIGADGDELEFSRLRSVEIDPESGWCRGTPYWPGLLPELTHLVPPLTLAFARKDPR